MHLAVSSFQRGVMIQFCGLVRVRYHFRFGFVRGQNLGDGISNELRIYNGETSLIPAGPRFGAMDSTLGKRCTWL